MNGSASVNEGTQAITVRLVAERRKVTTISGSAFVGSGTKETSAPPAEKQKTALGGPATVVLRTAQSTAVTAEENVK